MNMNYLKVFLSLVVLSSSGFALAAKRHETSEEENRMALGNLISLSENETAEIVAQARKLLRAGVGDINAPVPGYFGSSLLEMAVYSVFPQMVQVLIESGAQVDNPNYSAPIGFLMGDWPRGPFFEANRAKFERACTIMNLLIKNGYNINAQDASGDTLLHKLYFSVINGGVTPEAIKFLLSRGADLTIPSKARGGLRLDSVQGEGRIDKLLRAHVAQQELFRSIQNDNIPGINDALARGAQLGETDAQGNNAFHIAAMRAANKKGALTFQHLMRLLPVTERDRYCETKNNEGLTPLQILAKSPEAFAFIMSVYSQAGSKASK